MILLAAALCTGCVAGRASAPLVVQDRIIAAAVPARCPAPALQSLRGQPFTALAPVPLPGGLRVLRPAQPVTQDLQPARLNAQVDRQGRILRLFCG